MRLKALREKSIKEMNDELSNLLLECLNLRIQAANGQFQKTHLLKIARRNAARIKTLLTEKGKL